MRILSIDSSLGTQLAVVETAGAAEAAVLPGRRDTDAGDHALRVLSRTEQTDTRRHAESLGQMLSEALSTPDAADRPLVVGRTRGVPVHGVSSLDAVARRALDESAARGGEPDPVVLVATDARRREVYAALFRANGPDDVTRLTEIDVCPPTLVVERISEQAGGIGTVDLVAGSGAALYPELVEKTRSREALAPVSGDALTQVRIALARLGRGEELGTEPLYLRHADVQMPAVRKRVH